MAKKKSKKSNVVKLVLTIVVIALAVLAVCTLFMPVFTTKTTSSLIGSSSTSHIKGSEVISALFNSETSSKLSSGTNSLILLRGSEDASFVTTVFTWGYFLTIIVSAAILVFAVLSLFGLRFKLLNTILGAATVVLALVTFIFACVVAGKFGSVDIGVILSGKTCASVGAYFMFASLIAGGMDVCLARRK